MYTNEKQNADNLQEFFYTIIVRRLIAVTIVRS